MKYRRMLTLRLPGSPRLACTRRAYEALTSTETLATKEVKELARRLVPNLEYQQKLRERLLKGTLPPAVECSRRSPLRDVLDGLPL